MHSLPKYLFGRISPVETLLVLYIYTSEQQFGILHVTGELLAEKSCQDSRTPEAQMLASSPIPSCTFVARQPAYYHCSQSPRCRSRQPYGDCSCRATFSDSRVLRPDIGRGAINIIILQVTLRSLPRVLLRLRRAIVTTTSQDALASYLEP